MIARVLLIQLETQLAFIAPHLWPPNIQRQKSDYGTYFTSSRHLSTMQATWNSASLTIGEYEKKNIDEAVDQRRKQVSVYTERRKTLFGISAKLRRLFSRLYHATQIAVLIATNGLLPKTHFVLRYFSRYHIKTNSAFTHWRQCACVHFLPAICDHNQELLDTVIAKHRFV